MVIKTLNDKYHEEKLNASIYYDNWEQSENAISYYKTSDSINAATVSSLLVSIDDMEKIYKKEYDKYNNLKKENKKLNQRIGSLENLISISSTTTGNITSIVYVDSSGNKKSNFKDNWMNASITIFKDNSSDLDYEYIDSLEIIRTTKQKRFLFFFWKDIKGSSRVDAKFNNPDTKIGSLKWLEVKEK